MSNVQTAADLLFPVGQPGVLNVKFFRGTDTDLTAEELASQIVIANGEIAGDRAEVITDIDAR